MIAGWLLIFTHPLVQLGIALLALWGFWKFASWCERTR